jgi:hypothetical protein
MNDDKYLHTPITFSKYLKNYEDKVMERLEEKYTASTASHKMQSVDYKMGGDMKEWDKLIVSLLIISPLTDPLRREKLRDDIVECLHPWPKNKIVFMEDSECRNASNYHIINPRTTRHVFEFRIHAATPLEIGLSENGDLFL